MANLTDIKSDRVSLDEHAHSCSQILLDLLNRGQGPLPPLAALSRSVQSWQKAARGLYLSSAGLACHDTGRERSGCVHHVCDWFQGMFLRLSGGVAHVWTFPSLFRNSTHFPLQSSQRVDRTGCFQFLVMGIMLP